MPQPASPACDFTPIPGRKAPVIAVVGCDGSGKSTVCQTLVEEASLFHPTRLCHLGKQAGNLGRQLGQVPVLGPLIMKRSRREKARQKKGKPMTSLGAVANFLFVLRRVWRFWRMRRLTAHGYAIIADRYPQTVRPGPMDGPMLGAATVKGFLPTFLTALEGRFFNTMASFPPDLVLRLNVDLETAMLRKPDHDPGTLTNKIADVPYLAFRGAPILDLDACAPLEEVLAQARTASEHMMTAYGFHKTSPQPTGAVVALVGCDGSGKSSISAELVAKLGTQRPVQYGYLGLGSGDLGRKIGKWPLIGPFLERHFTKKAKKTRTKGEKIPGLATALVVFGFSLLRFRRFRKVQHAAQQGNLVITDRYPQMEVAGQCDGPGLSAATTQNPLIRALAALEKRLYRHMADQKPDLVVFLDVDAETALSRKPDHDLEALRLKAALMPQLTFNHAPRLVLDGRAPYAEVRDQVRRALQERGFA